jgi:hypothetical protein
MAHDAAAVAALADVPNVLLCAPSVGDAVDEGCKRLLGTGDADALLVVSFTLSPDEWVRRWIDRAGTLPDDVVVVTTSDAFTRADDGALPGPVNVESLSSPGDLTGVGMVISKYLERWHEHDRDMAVCFDSLTTLLQYAECKDVFRFLHLVTTRIDGADARAHFHLDPETQDRKTVSTLTSAFQAVAEHDGDAWAVRQR